MLVLIKSTPMSAAPHQEIVVETVDDEEEDLIDGSFLMKQWKDYFHVHSMEIK